MKTKCLILLMFLPGFAFAVELGASKAAVYSELGQPNGVMEMQNKEWLLYPRGKIVLMNDVVESSTLISQDELDTRLQREAEERQRLTIIAHQNQQRRLIEGDIAKAEILSDPDYYYKTTEQRYATWKVFRQQFPNTDISTEWIASLEAMEEVWEQKRLSQQIADLQDRVRRAENQVQQQQVQRTRYRYPLYVSYPRNYRSYTSTRACTLPATQTRQRGVSATVSAQNNGLAASLRFKSMQPVRMKPVTYTPVQFSL